MDDTRTSGPGADEPSFELIRRARDGDREALDTLFGRYLPSLRRWASGRLPGWARGLLDTEDMIQEAMLGTFNRIDEIEPRGEGALLAYLRRALQHRIIDEVRRANRGPRRVPVGPDLADPEASPLERIIGGDALARYERCLQGLSERDRELIVARIELGLGYDEIALRLDKPSRDAARMAVGRALLQLAKRMAEER